MSTIISYKKHVDSQITRTVRLPEDVGTHNPVGTELATINGITYVSLPDGFVLPSNQPAEISASISTAPIDAATLALIKAESPHCKLIAQRVIDKIRERYDENTEAYLTRIAIGKLMGTYVLEPGEDQQLIDYQLYVEQCRQCGRNERAALGF